MKKKLLLLLVLVLGFVVFIVARFFLLDFTQATGRVRIVSSPTAGVFIDDAPVGKTPYEAKLSVGKHKIKLIPEGNEDRKTISWEGEIDTYKNTLTYISRELGVSEVTSAGEVLTITKMEKKPEGDTGEVAVETQPTGAIIYLDNDEKGIAPLVLENVAAGDHEISLYLPGFFRRSQKINVEKGYRVSAVFHLALDQAHKTLEDELQERKAEASKEAALKKEAEEDEDAEEETTGSTVLILDTPTGFLNVRAEASTDGEILGQVSPDEEYEFTDQQEGWYFITVDETIEGWISADYAEEQ
ncbi:MAG: PEGA domain-containing protein [Weeksellaceae bacterium]